MTQFETDNWPYIPARDVGPKRTLPVRFVTIHTTESAETIGGARGIAGYFQHPDYSSSCTIVVDDAEIIQCVKDSYISYGAGPTANKWSIHVELVAKASQTREQWRDKFSLRMLALAADAVAQYCLKYGIPAIQCTNTELATAGTKGIVGHYQWSRVYKESDHEDPGLNFPWRRFICMVKELVAERQLIA